MSRIERDGLIGCVCKPLRPNHETLRGSADEMKRETGHQGQRVTPGGSEHPNVIRFHNMQANYAIATLSGPRFESYGVSQSDAVESAEKRIAMAGNADIARFTGQGRAGNMAGGAAQVAGVDAFHEHDREPAARNFYAAD